MKFIRFGEKVAYFAAEDLNKEDSQLIAIAGHFTNLLFASSLLACLAVVLSTVLS